MIVVAYIFLLYIFPENQIWIWLVIVLLTAAFIYALRMKNKLVRQLSYLLISCSLLLFTLNTNILPHLSSYQSSFEACRVFNREADDRSRLHIFTEDARTWEIFLYSKQYGRYMVTADDFKRVSPPVNDWLYTTREGLKLLSEMHVRIDTVRVLKHNNMTTMSVKLLNPKTRESKLKKRYLVKILKKSF
jgi:hypothetical protein